MFVLLLLASWSDQCSAVVYDYSEGMCYVEDAEENDAVCSEYREYYPCTVAGIRTTSDKER